MKRFTTIQTAMKTVVALAVSSLSFACTSCSDDDVNITVPNSNYKLTLEVDGDIVKDTTVAEGTLVNLSLFDGLADKETTAEFTYVFVGWEYLGETVKSVVVNEDMTVEAKYDEVVNKYNVTFVIEDELVEYVGTDLVQSIAYNGKVKFPEFECPKHVSYAWYDESGAMVEDFDNVKVSGDATYTAKCGDEKTSSVVVKFNGIERDDEEITFAWNESVSDASVIAKLGNLEVEGYTWKYENGVVTYTIKTFKVTFDFGGIRENVEVKVEYGKSAVAPTDVEVEGYTFDGWNGKFENVTSDNVVYAKYTAWTITISDKDAEGKVTVTPSADCKYVCIAIDSDYYNSENLKDVNNLIKCIKEYYSEKENIKEGIETISQSDSYVIIAFYTKVSTIDELTTSSIIGDVVKKIG